jgi:uncharacterized HAD superfamily protein
MNQAIIKNLHIVPRNIDLIVGIPRSGLLAANILALHLNLPLTDFDGLLEGRLIKSGTRQRSFNKDPVSILNGKILIVDDSVLTGKTIQTAKKQILEANLGCEVLYCAVFVSPVGINKVNLYFEEITGNRVFEWNFMNSWVLRNSCVDIDGVLCEDPTDEQNDDGRKYENFLANASPLWIPPRKVKYLVTCRLEKYRSLTEEWLQRFGVQYGKLIMMNFPTKEERLAAGNHAAFKAEVYKSSKTFLFIESSSKQAIDIAKIANKPVLCVETKKMIYPPILSYTISKLPYTPNFIYQYFIDITKNIVRHLLKIDPPKHV